MSKSTNIPDVRRPIHNHIVRSSGAFATPVASPLKGHYAELAPINLHADISGLFVSGHHGDPHAVWQFMAYGPFSTQKEMSAWLNQCAGSADPLWLVIRARSNSVAIGMAAFMQVRPAVGVAEIGHIWLGSAHQRTRESTEATYLMMNHILTDCRYRRLEWKCDACNTRSRRAAQRLGFRYEGTFYNHNIVKGRNRDTAWFSLLDSEWPPVRNAILHWLDPRNFDESGRQISALQSRAAW